MAERDIVTIITKEGCPACTVLKPRIPALKQRIEAVCPDVEVVEINWTKEKDNYPEDLDRHVNGFPCFCRFKRPSWNAAMINKKLRLEGYTYNAKWAGPPGRERAILDQTAPSTAEGVIIKWINNFREEPVGTVESRVSHEPDFCQRPISGGRNCKFVN